MKKILTTIAAILLVVSASAQNRFLVGGTGSNKIAIINKNSQQIEWQHIGFNKECGQCNSLIYQENGDIFYAHKKGAYMINAQREMLWKVDVKEGEEMQCVGEIKGGYMVGIAGTPTRILELDKNGKITKEVTFDTGVTNVHRQFRQIAKTKKGNYIVPVGMTKKILEVDAKGKIIRDIQLENQSLYVTINNDGDWIATTGHAGDIYKIDNKSGKISTVLKGKTLSDGTVTGFVAGIVQLRNGNYMLTNWVGHKGDQTQPIIIELNDKWEVVWTMKKIAGYTFAAGIYPIY
ncbi:MAG: hypothetical protein SNH35_07935 [Rikenellaceae bacterium]